MKSTRCLITTFSLLIATSAQAQVSYERIANAAAEPGAWLTYSGNYQAHRFSPLKEITQQNVSRLKPAWVYQIEARTRFETSPIVVDGVMYVTEPPTRVTALDLRTGRPLWTWQRKMPLVIKTIGFGPTNRGVAILDNTVYVGTLDCYVIALDAKSGAVRWETRVADNNAGHSITAAPLAIDGKIIVGISGGQVRLGIAAPREVRVLREEIYKAMQEENRAAANVPDSGRRLEDALKRLQSKKPGEINK